MIIRRYLVQQVMTTSLVVISLLTLVIMGGRLIKFFGVAAQGRLDASILFSIMGYRLPEFLILILPLGFFIGLILVFGRLYVDHEMAVFNASGISRGSLARLLIPMTFVFFIIHASLMLWVAPWGLRQFEYLISHQAVRSGFDLVRPKEFVSSGIYTIYAGSLSDDRKNLKDIFFYQRAEKEGKPDVMILAKEATRVELEGDSASVVDLVQGRRYEIYQDRPQYTQAEFESYRLRLESKEVELDNSEIEAVSLTQLWNKRHDPIVQSELGWRIFAPFVMWVALILAVALSEVSPRQGRYYKLFPAILLFASLIVIMMAIKTRISKDQLGIWAYPTILMIYAIMALFFSRKPKLSAKVRLSSTSTGGNT